MLLRRVPDLAKVAMSDALLWQSNRRKARQAKGLVTQCVSHGIKKPKPIADTKFS
jgi:hypothetical protein